jgi:glycosyltransferase involved in cell wall biosynthesis
VVVLHETGSLAEFLIDLGVTFECTPKVSIVSPGSLISQTAMMLSTAPSLARYIRRLGIDIVHTNDLRMHRTWGMAAKLAGARFVWYQRSADNSRRLALYSSLADRILTVSRFCKAQLPGAMGRRAIVVTSPFDPPSPRPDRQRARRELFAEIGAYEPAFVVGFIGNLTQQKRPLLFVEMAARLCELTDKRMLFPMFGEPRQPMQQQVVRLIAGRGLEERCFLMGPRHPIYPFMAACDTIVAPGVGEAFGRALVEATLVGTPLVAAKDGGNSEIITHDESGLLVTPDDPEAFANAVLHLMENPDEGARLAKAASISAAQRFSVKTHTEALLELYTELAGDKTGKASLNLRG